MKTTNRTTSMIRMAILLALMLPVAAFAGDRKPTASMSKYLKGLNKQEQQIARKTIQVYQSKFKGKDPEAFMNYGLKGAVDKGLIPADDATMLKDLSALNMQAMEKRATKLRAVETNPITAMILDSLIHLSHVYNQGGQGEVSAQSGSDAAQIIIGAAGVGATIGAEFGPGGAAVGAAVGAGVGIFIAVVTEGGGGGDDHSGDNGGGDDDGGGDDTGGGGDDGGSGGDGGGDGGSGGGD